MTEKTKVRGITAYRGGLQLRWCVGHGGWRVGGYRNVPLDDGPCPVCEELGFLGVYMPYAEEPARTSAAVSGPDPVRILWAGVFLTIEKRGDKLDRIRLVEQENPQSQRQRRRRLEELWDQREQLDRLLRQQPIEDLWA